MCDHFLLIPRNQPFKLQTLRYSVHHLTQVTFGFEKRGSSQKNWFAFYHPIKDFPTPLLQRDFDCYKSADDRPDDPLECLFYQALQAWEDEELKFTLYLLEQAWDEEKMKGFLPAAFYLALYKLQYGRSHKTGQEAMALLEHVLQQGGYLRDYGRYIPMLSLARFFLGIISLRGLFGMPKNCMKARQYFEYYGYTEDSSGKMVLFEPALFMYYVTYVYQGDFDTIPWNNNQIFWAYQANDFTGETEGSVKDSDSIVLLLALIVYYLNNQASVDLGSFDDPHIDPEGRQILQFGDSCTLIGSLMALYGQEHYDHFFEPDVEKILSSFIFKA